MKNIVTIVLSLILAIYIIAGFWNHYQWITAILWAICLCMWLSEKDDDQPKKPKKKEFSQLEFLGKL